MFLTVSFSKPSENCTSLLGNNFKRIKIKPISKNSQISYFAEFFTETQVFHKSFSESELISFINEHSGKTFFQCVYKTETEEITILGNKKGKITTLHKKTDVSSTKFNSNKQDKNYLLKSFLTANTHTTENKNKSYILKEGTPIPFLVFLGIMTPNGKIISSKYAKFRQINRFLELLNDILEETIDLIKIENNNTLRPIQIADFGCGKSYLTFAVYYFLSEIKKLPINIIGLDLKKDVINYCNKLAEQFNYKNLKFYIGNIADYNYTTNPDIVITLHACDTATDFALKYAVGHNAKAILSVPCCQHEINQQINTNKKDITNIVFSSILKHGILKEKFSALVTDSLRAEFLEQQNYKVQVLEFIDTECTPKNLLIRAVKKQKPDFQTIEKSQKRSKNLIEELNINPTIFLQNK